MYIYKHTCNTHTTYIYSFPPPPAFVFFSVMIVATVTATNNYNKELQFRALEEAAKKDDRIFVRRGKY